MGDSRCPGNIAVKLSSCLIAHLDKGATHPITELKLNTVVDSCGQSNVQSPNHGFPHVDYGQY